MRKKNKKRKDTLYITLHYLITLIPIFILAILIYQLVSTKFSIPCANSQSCKESLKLKVENEAIGIFNNHKVIPPKIDLSQINTTPKVLGTETATGEKHIYVDLKKQKLYAFQGETLFMTTFVSTGLWGRTPPGDYTIWVKLLSTRMTGGSGDDYYDLPNVEYVMFFYNTNVSKSKGYGLHTAYWHNNFGHRMSHGCVNMRRTDAEKLYHWADPPTNGPTTYADNENKGTKVTISEDLCRELKLCLD